MNEFTTLVTFSDPMEAEIARARLEEDGIPAFLVGAEMASTLWTMTNAIGGVKLQVPTELVAKAAAILQQTPAAGNVGEVQYPDDEIESTEDAEPEDEDPDEEFTLTTREQEAERAFKSAIFGLLFCPLQLYACYLMINVVTSEEPLRGKSRSRAWWAGGIVMVFVLGGLWFLWMKFTR